ncbi:ABC transporter [Colletotrichum tofieldiae]|nr:ABC transporter [Colletotrichum tofieldiae]
MAVALYNVLNFNRSLANLITSWTELETSLGAISRSRTFESQTPVEPSPTEEALAQLPPHWPTQGQLEIKNIKASYSPNSKPVLDDVTLSISPRDKIAICGQTGSGKSFLALTILKLLRLDSGSIEIDSIDIARIPNNVLRQRLIAIPQEPLLFPGTLRINLFPYGDVLSSEEMPSDDNLVDALNKVSLWSTISLHGASARISQIWHFQKGKCNFCALHGPFTILILDEATSAVDQETEELMTGTIDSEFADHTVISVIHRPQSLRGIDKVVTMQGAGLKI